ncbi:hypothetical protein JW859_04840 [bacterium]|nr:hypothetical protein [bacterium]
MGIFSKLLGGSKSKLAPKVKQAERLLDSNKLAEAVELIETLWQERSEETSEEELALLSELRHRQFKALLELGKESAAIELAGELVEVRPDALVDIAETFVDRQIIDPRALELILTAVDKDNREKRLLIAQAKQIIKVRGNDLVPEELNFIIKTASEFTLWKEGQGMLADRCLKENRRDAEALQIYRNAYPNRKADRRLREVLLESLIANEEIDEFAADVYRDTVETSDAPEALRLLAQYYIMQDQFTPATIPYIERALQRTKLSPESLKKLSAQTLNSTSDFIDRGELLQAIYRQGYSDHDLLAYLGEYYAQANKFDNEAIEVMTKAFELRMVSKRAILILTEHCLANDREDDFSIRVYESYLSTWPDRPQRRIYEILAHHYANLTRVDEQAQKIYQEALVDSPTDPVVITILARAYRAADRRDDIAEEIYRHAFPIAGDAVKVELATVLAEMRVGASDFSEETLQYLTVMGRPERGPLVDQYDEALTNCFLAAGRRGEQAQQAYFALFERTEDTSDLNPRLVTLLADIIKERGVAPASGSVEMRVYQKLFEQHKFSTDADISFVLLEDTITQAQPRVSLLNLAVRCFEADADALVGLLKQHQREKMLREIGDFYIEHYNFAQAARAYDTSFRLSPTDDIRYRLAKIHLLENRADLALEHLKQLNAPEYAILRCYWEAAAHQQLGNPDRAEELIKRLEGSDVPLFLISLRKAINLELKKELEKSLEIYTSIAGQEEYAVFERWLQLERGIVLMRLERLDEAHQHLEEIHRRNPNGRAEQLFFSLALFLEGHVLLKADKLDQALPLFTRAVEVNRNHRLLRQVIVELLSLYGETAFFQSQLERSVRILEVANRILPKRTETKTYLAYGYHRLKDYAKAIIYYHDITWTDENPRLERSHAYAYLANQQPQKAWRVFLDLARRGNMLETNFPRLVACFLADTDARGGQFWGPVEFPENVDGLLLAALYIHDGDFQRAAAKLEELLRDDKHNPQLRWYLGQAYAQMGKREMAVFNWLELSKLVENSSVSPEMKIRQFTEIGLAFLGAGYAPEAMQTWDKLRQLDESNADLPILYAATLDLNAYQLARKDQNKLALEEWKKALNYDPENPNIVQNCAVICLLVDDYDSASANMMQLARLWAAQFRADRKTYGHLENAVNHLEKAMNTLALTKGRAEFDITKVRAEDIIHYYQKANQFYWILSLDKRATHQQIETEYFRLIKIFNPERHADDFMLVEESYSNLFADPHRRAMIDLFVFNPVDAEQVRSRLSRIPRDRSISFEQLTLPDSIPPPDFQQLEPPKSDEAALAQPLLELLEINFKIPDWTVL